jgi:CDP-diglyceride synthetase
MLQENIFSYQLSEAPLDLRAPVSSKIRKGGWWLRLGTLITVDFTLLMIAWTLIEYQVFSEPENLYFSMLATIFIQISALAIQGTYEPGDKRHDYLNIIKTMIFAHGIILFLCFVSTN